MLKADVGIDGPIDGTGRPHSDGDYLRLYVEPEGVHDGRHFRISRGQAEGLLSDLKGLLDDRN